MDSCERTRPRHEGGATMAFVAILLFVFLGMAALAVDLGRLMGARTQAQRTADSAALAGAGALMWDVNNDGAARELAVEYGGLNPVMGTAPEVRPDEDVDVDLTLSKVTVRVHRTDAWGGPITNVFARAIGFNASNVSTVAAAQASPAGSAFCPLPFVLIDRWYDENLGRLTSQWEDPPFTRDFDYYEAGGANLPYQPYGPTGWGIQDRGTLFRIKMGNNGEAPQPGWYFPVALDAPGGNAYRDAIATCDPSIVVELGQEIDIEPGKMVGPTAQGFKDLIEQDPTAYWDPQSACLMHTADSRPGPGGTTIPIQRDSSGCTTNGSPRVRPMVVLSPEEAPESSGRQPVIVRGFAAVFVVCVGNLQPGQQSCSGSGGQQQDVWVRYLQLTGGGGGAGGPSDPNSLIKFLQLVE